MQLPDKIIASRIFLVQPFPPSFQLAEEIFQAVDESRSKLNPWLGWVDSTLRAEDSFTYLTDWCQKNRQNQSGFAYLIRDNQSQKLLGIIDFFNISTVHLRGEIGYWLRSSAEGHGYMSEALTALEKAIFDAGINSICIHNETQNHRSANVAQRCGYHLDGIVRQNRWNAKTQQFVDTNIWSKLKSEYK